jgi:hypothetical protein
VVEEEVGDVADEHHDLDVWVGGQLIDDLDQPDHGFADDEVRGWVGEGDPRDLR